MTDTFSPEAIIEQAQDSLDALDDRIHAMRAEKHLLGVRIAAALEQRKPLARIVAAAKPRQRKAEANGD